MAGAAAEVGDRAGDRLGERRQQRPASGLPASSAPNNAAYVDATASYERRVASSGSTRRTVAGSPDSPLHADNRHYVNSAVGGLLDRRVIRAG